jgi:hypothetical protein
MNDFYYLKVRWPVRFPGRRMAGRQNGRLSRPCAMAENFGFRGVIGLSGLDLFGAMPKRTIKIGLLTFSAAPKINVLDRSDEKKFYYL